ncbi:MAG: hypothetical protein AAF682_05570 [Planctomycetota bacterium]
MKLLPLTPVLLAAAATAHADVLTVGPPGSGADFAQIRDAMVVADDGDVVLVAEGTYDPFTMTRAVRVVGAGPGKTFVADPFSFGGYGATKVLNLSAGEVAAIVGITALPDPLGGALVLAPLIGVGNCDGLVVLHDVEVDAGVNLSALNVEQTSAVVVSRCQLSGGASTSAGPLERPVSFVESTGWAVDSTVARPPFAAFLTSIALDTLALRGSQLVAAGSALLGGETLAPYQSDGGDAAFLESSVLTLARSEARGGQGVVDGGYGAWLTSGSQLVVQADSEVAGGLDGQGKELQDPLLLSGGSGFAFEPAIAPTLSAAPTRAAAGDPVDVTLFGTPGSGGRLFVALDPADPAQVPGIDGAIFMDPAEALLLGALTLDAAGQASVSFALPALPAATGKLLTLQWVELGDAPRASNPAFVALL